MNAKLSGWPCLSTTDEKVKDIVSVKLVVTNIGSGSTSYLNGDNSFFSKVSRSGCPSNRQRARRVTVISGDAISECENPHPDNPHAIRSRSHFAWG